MTRTLIIGGSRFLGPRLIELLKEKGHEVVLFNRGTDYGQKLSEVTRIAGDRRKEDDLEKVFAKDFDYVYDMCCYDAEDAGKLLRTVTPSAHLIFFSTAAVYQKPKLFPLHENSQLGPWASFGTYGEDKAAAEQAFIRHGKKYHAKTTIFRPVYLLGNNNYFDRENYYFSRIEKGLPILAPGNGNALVQFAFLEETAQAFANIPAAQQVDVEILNIGGNDYVSLNGLIELCARIVDKPVHAVHITTIPGIDEEAFYDDIYPFPNLNFIVSNQKVCSEYGVTFRPLDEGLYDIYKAWRRNWNGLVHIYPKEAKTLKKLEH